MSKKYVCDICGKVISDPYEAKMREFYMSLDYDGCMISHTPVKTFKKRIHLCGYCFNGLVEAAVNKKEV